MPKESEGAIQIRKSSRNRLNTWSDQTQIEKSKDEDSKSVSRMLLKVDSPRFVDSRDTLVTGFSIDSPGLRWRIFRSWEWTLILLKMLGNSGLNTAHKRVLILVNYTLTRAQKMDCLQMPYLYVIKKGSAKKKVELKQRKKNELKHEQIVKSDLEFIGNQKLSENIGFISYAWIIIIYYIPVIQFI
ncbi:hypothetical protein QQ045_014897 [Rhodiola kirilowii]